MSVPCVSVIVPTRDRLALLPAALASVRALEGPDLAIELLVVENGDGDHERTEAIARTYGARHLRSAAGASNARNTGMRAATGEFLAFLDDDDRFLPGHLRPHVRLLRERPELAGVVGQAVNASADFTTTGTPWPAHLPDNGDLFAAFLGYCPQIGATVVRASVRESVGSFDPDLTGDEDWDWHLRLALRHAVGFVPVPCVLFRQRPPGADIDIDRARLHDSRRVLLRNLRRAGWRRVSWQTALRSYLGINAAFSHRLLGGACARLAAGDEAGARRALRAAVAASPLHAGRAALRDGALRRELVRSLLPR